MSVSVVIPCYNARKTIGPLVSSIKIQTGFSTHDEIIVVDDRSTDDSAHIAEEKGGNIITMPENSGPAAARNTGVEHARNDIILFLDADTLLEPGSLEKIKRFFEEHPDAACVNGRCSMTPILSSPARDYKALVEYDWHEELLRKNPELTCFNARIGAIKKDIFMEIGGFDSRFRGAEVEDFEFSYRLIKKYKIHFLSDVQVRHLFPNFIGTVKDYWSRAGKWAELFLSRGKFDGGGTTAANGFGHIVGSLIPILALISPAYKAGPVLLLISLIIFLWVFRMFFFLVFMEKGGGALLTAISLHVIYSCIIASSASIGLIQSASRKLILREKQS